MRLNELNEAVGRADVLDLGAARRLRPPGRVRATSGARPRSILVRDLPAQLADPDSALVVALTAHDWMPLSVAETLSAADGVADLLMVAEGLRQALDPDGFAAAVAVLAAVTGDVSFTDASCRLPEERRQDRAALRAAVERLLVGLDAVTALEPVGGQGL